MSLRDANPAKIVLAGANPRILVLALLLAVCAAYANSFHNSFHFDDFHTVTDNPAIRSLRNIPRFFVDATTFSVLPTNRTYRPMVSTTLALDYALGNLRGGGYVPFWFHFGTFLSFLALIVLLNQLYLEMLNKARSSPRNAWLALMGSAWFALHPVMAETVNYVIQRGDLYCTLGCVGALWIFVRYPAKRPRCFYLLPLVFALLSKPPAAVFPVLLVGYFFLFEARERRLRASIVAALPSIVVTGTLMALQSAMTPRTFAPSMLSPSAYRLAQPYVWLHYCSSLFLPLHLSVDSDLSPFPAINLQAALGLLFLVALIAVLSITCRHRTLYPICFGLLWFIVTQLPTSLYPLSEVENDHRMFFSFPGLILAAVLAVDLLYEKVEARYGEPESPQFRRVFRPASILVVPLLLGAYARGVVLRNRTWRTEESLWLDNVSKSPRNGRGLMIYGLTQMSKGDYPVALSNFEHALAYTPNYPALEINLGVVNGALADQGEPGRAVKAEQHFMRAIALAPADDLTHAYYARWLLAHGRTGEAVPQLRTAVLLNPQRAMQRDLLIDAANRNGDAAAAREAAASALAVVPDDAAALRELAHPAAQDATYWINLSLTQYQQRQYLATVDSARRALQIQPNLATAYNNMGAAYAAMGQWDEALRAEREAIERDPSLQIARNNLRLYSEQGGNKSATKSADELLNESLTLNKSGRFEDSIATAREALQLNPRMAEAWNNIAAAYESLHRWDPAIDAAQRAVALDPGFELAKNNLAWSISQKRLEAR